MVKGFLVGSQHLPKRVNRQNQDKRELLILWWKPDLKGNTPVNQEYLYPEDGVTLDVLQGDMGQEIALETGPDPRNLTRNIVKDVRLVGVKVPA